LTIENPDGVLANKPLGGHLCSACITLPENIDDVKSVILSKSLRISVDWKIFDMSDISEIPLCDISQSIIFFENFRLGMHNIKIFSILSSG
jgi:hypothetical protein